MQHQGPREAAERGRRVTSVRDRLLYAENTDQWLDIVEWSSMDAATRAAEAINASADCLDFISKIEEKEMQELQVREVALP